jgi:hypothetical protein
MILQSMLEGKSGMMKKKSGTREGMTPALLFRQFSAVSYGAIPLYSDLALADIRIVTSKRLEFPPTK